VNGARVLDKLVAALLWSNIVKLNDVLLKMKQRLQWRHGECWGRDIIFVHGGMMMYMERTVDGVLD
jgi:hypothetical protein